ncbi:MAG: tRNA (adenosine(37)-N6)-dimethylallyltransferase MiaA [Desulfonatronovibrio sp.]
MHKNKEPRPRIICVIGPTCSGKNDLALGLSKDFPLEIINFDSRQVYVDLPVITAQPSEQEKKICAHHLYGFLGLRDRISAGRFVERAGDCIKDVHGRGSIPVLVGGTGMYLRSLIYGLADIPAVPGEITRELENECRRSGVEGLYHRLKYLDPVYAETITDKDRQKIIRALGVYTATGKPFSRWHQEQNKDPRYNVLKLGIMEQLEELTPRLEQRITRMIQQGAIEEVQRAWEKSGHDPSCPAFSGIGCREVIEYIQGETDLDQARKSWLKNTRSYAKRQLTWFRKEPDIIHTSRDKAREELIRINDFLAGSI